LKVDSTGGNIGNLKTFYETIILNNPGNTDLISKIFNYIQKCNVILNNYQSALNGYQQIIDQNPYSYEGLVASWDYAATSLLLSGGSGGGEKSNYELPAPPKEMPSSRQGGRGEQITNYPQSEASDLKDNNIVIEDNNKSKIQDLKSKILNDDPNDKYDTKVFTKEDRKILKENIFNSFESSRSIVIDKIKSLDKKISDGKADRNEKTEYENRKILNELAEPKNPRNIEEHINNINSDLTKIFGNAKSNFDNKNNKNTIPTQYSLSQNYPNPFNPNTKINFELPNDAKVNLIVYDLLGREIIKLVNNEFRTAGSYTVDFNGSNLSSGIYFYRLETTGFSMTKKMLLVK